MPHHILLPAVFAAATLAVLPGCLVASHSNKSYTGTYISPSTMSQIEPGKTTKDWVVAVLGQPASKCELDDGSAIWKWTYVERERSRGAVLFLFSGSNNKESVGATYIQFRDGVVVKSWRD